MKSPRELIDASIKEVVSTLAPQVTLPLTLVRACQDLKHGDFQSNAAMLFAKGLGLNPRLLAEQIVEKLGETSLFLKPEIAGPGFINFKIKPEACAEQIAVRLPDSRLGIDTISHSQTIVFDFSGPNIAKEMHVGHIRSTILGESLSRIYRFIGHSVITDNHLGDWGTQFGMVILGYKRGGNEEALKADPFGHLETLYKAVQEETKTNESTLQLARQELLKLQQGDAENRALWQKFIDLSLAAIDQIYARLGVKFDHTLGESFYNDALQSVVNDLKQKGIAQESEGAVVVFSDKTLPPKEDPFLVSEKENVFRDNPFIIQKSDKAFLYGTTDLATVQYRVEKWKADRAVYVTDSRQQMHFNQLFATIKRWGLPIKLDHVWFGAILGEDKTPLKTREGKPIKLRLLLDEAETRALAIITEKHPDWDEEKRQIIAKKVGIGALKYADLSQNRNNDYVFQWEKLLAFDGNTAPYLQNAYVRIRSIFRRNNFAVPSQPKVTLDDPAELALAKKLLEFRDAIEIAAHEYRPHFLCVYLFELATTFHKFYENCPVRDAELPLQQSRLVLCEFTSKTLAKGLELLGIETLDEM
ncbi:MAG: arginine--tRNA ligase [Verrucomicrobiota bacterium]